MVQVPVAIVGPTASGKSALAMDFCLQNGGEIISCDSVQVYRDFEIGCAKPTGDERRQVPHHLIDVADWSEEFDAQRYCRLALASVTSCYKRGRWPVFCGGTGLYLRALRFGLIDVPQVDPNLRHSLMDEELQTPGALYKRLQILDPASADVISPNNLVYIARALEIALQTGEQPSRLRAAHGFREEKLKMQVFAIDWPAAVLKERIGQRVKKMLQQGLIEEVQVLLKRGVSPTCRPMASIGYRQVCDVLLHGAPSEQLETQIVQQTWRYAKRQLTWLKRERGVSWIPVSSVSEMLTFIYESLHGR